MVNSDVHTGYIVITCVFAVWTLLLVACFVRLLLGVWVAAWRGGRPAAGAGDSKQPTKEDVAAEATYSKSQDQREGNSLDRDAIAGSGSAIAIDSLESPPGRLPGKASMPPSQEFPHATSGGHLSTPDAPLSSSASVPRDLDNARSQSSSLPALVRWWSIIGFGGSILMLIRAVDPTVTFDIYTGNSLMAISCNFGLLLLAFILTFVYVNTTFMLKVTRLRRSSEMSKRVGHALWIGWILTVLVLNVITAISWARNTRSWTGILLLSIAGTFYAWLIVLSISTFKLNRFAQTYIGAASSHEFENSAYARTQSLLKKARWRILVFHHVIWLFGGALALGSITYNGIKVIQGEASAAEEARKNPSEFHIDSGWHTELLADHLILTVVFWYISTRRYIPGKREEPVPPARESSNGRNLLSVRADEKGAAVKHDAGSGAEEQAAPQHEDQLGLAL